MARHRPRLQHWKILAALALCVPGAALADVRAGVDAWSRGDYDRAVREWQKPADAGDADALFNLGQAYKLGRGVKADLARAEQLFGQAATKGHLQAADLYGLLLFQRGEREKAIPYVVAAADRGEPRAQYLLGVASFNGDGVAKDWVRAYALTSLALQADVPQAKAALAQMDEFIPLEQRQQAAKLAPELASRAEAARSRQLAAVDLGATVRDTTPAPVAPALAASESTSELATKPAPPTSAPRRTAEQAARIANAVNDDTPRSAGADFARPQPAPAPLAVEPVHPGAPVQARPPRPAQAAANPAGQFSIQLGAFAIAGNAAALWDKVKARPELAGTSHKLIDGGKLTRLLATGFETRAHAQSACTRLAAAGFGCIVARN